MNKKILQVFYGADALPYKDKERTVHFPIVGNAIQNANNTTQIKFYFDRLIEENEQTTFVAVSKLPNGKIGSKILETYDDEELGEQYALLDLDSFYTQYKGDVFISLQGYQGGVRVEQDEQGIYQIYGTPVIAATGSIKLSINYAPSFVGSGETENVTLQQVLGELSTKLGVRQETLHVEELPTIGNQDVWYVVNDDEDDPNKQNIYIWNATTQSYVWVGDNTLDLGDYYTQEQGQQFESDIDNRVTSVENELSSVAQGSPKGVYATVSELETAYPTGTSGIFVVTETGNWYYWNGTQWTSGGTYLSSNDYDLFNEKINAIDNIDIDYGTLITGKYVNGNGVLADDTGSCASDFVKVKPLSKIRAIDITCRGGRSFCVYDENKTLIRYLAAGTGDQSDFVFAIPDNGEYIRFSCLTNKVPKLFYTGTLEDLENYSKNDINFIENSLYKNENYYLQSIKRLAREQEVSTNNRITLYYFGFYGFNNRIKIVNNTTTIYSKLVAKRVPNVAWGGLSDWLVNGTFELDVPSYNIYGLYLKKVNDSPFTDEDIENIKENIHLYSGYENMGNRINDISKFNVLDNNFEQNPSLSPYAITQQDCTPNPDGSITIASGGFYFVYYLLNGVLNGDVAVRFFDNAPNIQMQVAKSSAVGTSIMPYINMKFNNGWKYIVLSKDLFNDDYPYLCVRIDNRYSDNSYTFSKLNAIDTKLNVTEVVETLFVSPDGSDDNDGKSSVSPLATVNKALSLGASNILLLGGTYNQQISLSSSIKKKISIRNYTENEKVLFRLDENTIATSETQVSGYTKVYSFTFSQELHERNIWLFQENVADITTLISESERNALQRGYEYRCEDTKIVKCSSTVLADALNEIENASSNVYKWYQDGTTIYFSRPHEVSSDYPICASFGKSLFTNGNRAISLEVAGINSKYINFGLQRLGYSKIIDCKSSNNYSSGAFVYDRCLGIEFIRCEAEQTFTGSNGDGFNGHSLNTGDAFAKQTTCTLIDCWSHDNNDDGYSDHERSEITIIGGLYEYNKKCGITPSYGSHCTCYNVYSRKNYCGFGYVGDVDPLEGGKYGQMTCFYCVAENNSTGGSRSGFLVNGANNSMLLIGCKSIGHTNYGYCVQEQTNKATLIDCTSLNDNTQKGGSGTFTIKNTTIVE